MVTGVVNKQIEREGYFLCEHPKCKAKAAGYEEYKGMIIVLCQPHHEWFQQLPVHNQVDIILAYNVQDS
jgi:hypothetical protein